MSGALEGKTALVTGAGRGFGYAIARTFVAQGATVIAHYRSSKAPLDELKKTASGRVVPVQADLRASQGASALLEAAVDAAPTIDVLVNNAGSMVVGPFADSSEEAWSWDIDLNIRATLRITHGVLPAMTPGGDGRIINLSSQLALRPWDRGAVYAGTKGFLLSWTKSLAAELGPQGITVNAIGPGSILTDMNTDVFPDESSRNKKALELPLRRMGSPQDVGDAALFLASARSSFITGQYLGVNGGSQM